MTTMTQTTSTAPPSAWLEVHPVLGISLMDHLWNRLDGAYPHKFRSAFANAQAVANWRESWAEMFDDEGLTPDEVRAGLKRCRTMFDWPPSFAEFLRACRPPIDTQAAWAEAIEQMRIRLAGGADRWSRPHVYWAAVAIGAHDLNALAWETIRARWERALENAKADPVPEFVPALPAPGAATVTREEARKRAAALGANLHHAGTAGTGWAVELMIREANGGPIASVATQFWRDALGFDRDVDAKSARARWAKLETMVAAA